MIKTLKDGRILTGLILTIASALICAGLTWFIFSEETIARMQGFLFDCGIDALGSFVCAALFFGCRKQEGDGGRAFRILIIMLSASFLVNAFVAYLTGMPGQGIYNFVFILLNKLLDLAMIYYFYQYIKIALGFEGELARWVDKGILILLVLQSLILLANIFYPVTFQVDADGIYQPMPASLAEDIYLIAASVMTTILIIRSKSPRSEKVAALTFIFLPIINYVATFTEYGDASNYGMTLMSLIIMYCIIFNANSAKLEATQAELETATDIQTSMLPASFPEREEFDLHACMKTAKEVGGDFYDYFMIDQDHLCIVIADVSGKGMPAALFMMRATTIIKDHALTGNATSDIFTSVNARLCENNDESMFVTAWIGILDLRTMKLQYTNAGHNYPVLQRNGQPCDQVKEVHGLFLAGLEFTVYRQSEIELKPGDRLMLFTDGVTEAHNQAGELYGEDRLKERMEETRGSSGGQVLDIILNDIYAFSRGVPQFDDITMAVLTIKEQEEEK